jgi:hypothetical protein
MRSYIHIAMALTFALAAGPASAQTRAGHEDHQGHGSQAGQAPAPPTGQDGDWAYGGRDNPRTVTRNRWIMVPGESGAMYRSAAGVSPADRCRALLGSPRTIVDEGTRAACGRPSASTAPVAPPHADHSQHR